MDNIFSQLKKLQRIEAHEEFTRRSRSFILNTGVRKKLTLRQFLISNFELGASVALAGILILIIVGGFSTWKVFSPLQLSNLDASALKAEANAVDMQIELTKLAYKEIVAQETEAAQRPAMQKISPVKLEKSPQNDVSAPSPDSAGAESVPARTLEEPPLTIDEALGELSK